MAEIDKTHDARGRGCPMVMVELNKTINTMQIGEVLEFLTDDRVSRMDIPSWSSRTGHELIGVVEEPSSARYLIRKCERARNAKRQRDFSQY